MVYVLSEVNGYITLIGSNCKAIYATLKEKFSVRVHFYL